MFDSFASGTIATSEAEIAFVTAGRGPPVLLLHGYPQCKAMWAPVARTLGEAFTVVCSDLRGYGGSSKPRADADAANYSFRQMALDQLELMRALGHERFHLVGHDRGGRVAHRMALDHPAAVLSLTVLDIVPTHVMFARMNAELAQAYWHWSFLSQPGSLPERIIGLDPDLYFETILSALGGCSIESFPAAGLAAYRRFWRDPAMIHASCADYRATEAVDLANDREDLSRVIGCPSLVGFADCGKMARLFDIAAEWRRQLRDPVVNRFPGGHFFVDQHPDVVSDVLGGFLRSVCAC